MRLMNAEIPGHMLASMMIAEMPGHMVASMMIEQEPINMTLLAGDFGRFVDLRIHGWAWKICGLTDSWVW